MVPASFNRLCHPRQNIRLLSFSRSSILTRMARTSMIKAAAAAAKKAEQSSTKSERAPPGNVWISEDKLAELYPTINKDGRISLPGFHTPVNYMPDHDGGSEDVGTKMRWVVNRCPNALQEWAPEPLTVRERNMMQTINALTDKSEWRRRVFDETILAKWRAEAVTGEGQGFTEKMFDYVSYFLLLLIGTTNLLI